MPIDYLKNLGFSGVRQVSVSYKEDQLLAFKYRSFNPSLLRNYLGKPTKFREGLFIFVLANNKAIRINTHNNGVLLGNTNKAVSCFLKNCK